jgi:hypothetical protein
MHLGAYKAADVLVREESIGFSYNSLAELSQKQRMNLICDWQNANLANSRGLLSGYGTSVLTQFLQFRGDTSLFSIGAQEKETIIENAHWKVIAAENPDTPLETLVIAKSNKLSMENLSYSQRSALATILSKLATRYDNLLMESLGCEITWHVQKPNSDTPCMYATYKPLLDTLKAANQNYRRNNARFHAMSGKEITQLLKNLSDIHYSDIF